MKAEMLKGHLEALLLASVEAGPAHGYAIVETLRNRSGGAFDLPEGTVYPALHRLEAAGLLESEWSAQTGRRRRVYALTQSGARALAQSRQQWRAFSDGVNAVLGGLPCTNPT